jgi:hypothetical protein
MKIDELTLGQIKEIQSMCGNTQKNHPYKIGEKYLIRTVTMIYTGRLEAVYDQELVISDAAWIADTGRWEQCVKEGTLNEVEPYGDGNVIIGRGSILDVSIWIHDLPRKQK